MKKLFPNFKFNKKIFKKITDRPGHDFRYAINSNKIRNKLNWKPKINFKDGINIMLNEIYKWNDPPLWTPKKIKKATKIWFNYLSKK